MTIYAAHVVMLGGLPGIIIRLHDVATVAKGGAGRVIKEIDEDRHQNPRANGQHFIKPGT